jgi:uncharacterized protein YdhG (YjbR/CyaY superfamily)
MNEIDKYISVFPEDVKTRMQSIRELVHAMAPSATETIKYRMPTFVLNGNLIHFAAFKNHIGLYPLPAALDHFKKDLSVYKTGKGSVQFPHSHPLPMKLIKKIVEFRLKEQLSVSNT